MHRHRNRNKALRLTLLPPRHIVGNGGQVDVVAPSVRERDHIHSAILHFQGRDAVVEIIGGGESQTVAIGETQSTVICLRINFGIECTVTATKERTGARISVAVAKGLHLAIRSGQVVREDSFFSPVEPDVPIKVRNRATASATVRKADMLPPSEINAAIQLAIQHNGYTENEELVIAVSRLFGFDRAGPDLKAAIETVLKTCSKDVGEPAGANL